jgi:phosphatidylinositol alpha-1,6-mannosyltransferase
MILILTQCFPSRLGGVESLVSNLALGLSKTEKVIVFADRHHIFYDAIYDNLHKDKILVRRAGGIKFFRRRKKIKEIKPFIETRQVKLVIADSWKSLELGIEFLNLKKTPVVCLAHGNELLSTNPSKKKRIFNTISKVSLVVPNSLFTQKLVDNLLIRNTKVKFIYPGAVDFRNNNSLETSNITGSPVLLTLARLEKRKGHIFVLQSIKKLKIQYPNIQYIIAGSGSEKKILQNFIISNDLSKNVFFVGNVNDDQKKFLFEKTDLMVMPTLDESGNNSIEGFGIAYLEAAFFGIPSIASNVGGTSEAVLHNSTGIIINHIEDLHDAILDLLINKEKRFKLGIEAQNRVIKSFKWETIVNNHLSIYKNFLIS